MEEVIRERNISTVCIVVRLFIDMLAMAFFIGIYWIVRDGVKFVTTKLIITSKRVTGKTGLINTNQLDSPLNKINGVQVRQGLFGQIFNYGTISITTASTTFNFDYIAKPNDFRAALNEQIEKYDDERMQKQATKMAEAMK